MSVTEQVRRPKLAGARTLVCSTLKLEREALAASQLRDEELLKAAKEALRDMPREEALILVSRISATFGRITSLLAAGRSGRLLADLKECSLEARTGLVERKKLLTSGAVTEAAD